jgi:hypothetical protein
VTDLDCAEGEEDQFLAHLFPSSLYLRGKLWEFHIAMQLSSRCSARNDAKTVSNALYCAQKLYASDQCGVLLYPQAPTTTLAHLFQSSMVVPEALALFYSLELMSILTLLHVHAGVLHTNIHPELLLLNGSAIDEHCGPWTADKRHGWADKGLSLSGFQWAIDTRLFPAHTRFQFDEVDRAERTLLREDFLTEQGFHTIVDRYNAVHIMHLLFFGKPLDAKRASDSGGWKIIRSTDAHNAIYTCMQTLLNCKEGQEKAVYAHVSSALGCELAPAADQLKNSLCELFISLNESASM